MGTASCPPTGASHHVTQPAVEIQFHLLHGWCFHLAFQGTEKHSVLRELDALQLKKTHAVRQNSFINWTTRGPQTHTMQPSSEKALQVSQ